MSAQKRSQRKARQPNPNPPSSFSKQSLSEWVAFRVTVQQRASLAERAKSLGVNESDVIRKALDGYFSQGEWK
jgi:hypothetical protein